MGAARRRQADSVREGGRHVVRAQGAPQAQVLTRPARIVVSNLVKTFRDGAREVAAVDGVSFEILDKEFTAIVGPSGCGKSTILNMIGGLTEPTAGTVEIDGCPVRGTPPKVGYVFQKDTVFPWRTVARNIALGLEYAGIRGEEQARRVREAITLAGLDGFEDAFPATLSGGMRQRAALMRTLVVEPEILLMDEPFGALDTHTKIDLHGELLNLWGARRQTVVFITHDLSEAITLADRVIVMTRRPGRIKLVHDVKIDRPRDVIRVRESDAYAREYSHLWHVLGEEFARARGGA